MAGDGLLVGQHRHLVDHHPQAGRVVRRLGPGLGERRVQRVRRLRQQRVGELGEQLALAGLHRQAVGVAHDVAQRHRLQQRHLGARARGHDEVGAVTGERPLPVPLVGRVGGGEHEPAHQLAGQPLERELARHRGRARRPRRGDDRQRRQLAPRLPQCAGVAAEVPGREVDEHVALGGVAQRREVDATRDDAVLDVVHGVRHVVGPVHDLRLEAPLPLGRAVADPGEDGGVGRVGAVLALPRRADPGVLAGGVERGPRQVQPAARDLQLQPGEDAQRLGVALEAAARRAELVERALAVVPERRVADVVGEPGRVDDVGVAAQVLARCPARSGRPPASA